MSNLINRQDAIKATHQIFWEELEQTPHEMDENGDDLYTDTKTVNLLLHCNKRVSKMLEALPSIRPTGKWIRRVGTGALCSCSECGHNIWDVDIRIHKFCPNCGADMRDKDHE